MRGTVSLERLGGDPSLRDSAGWEIVPEVWRKRGRCYFLQILSQSGDEGQFLVPTGLRCGDLVGVDLLFSYHDEVGL